VLWPCVPLYLLSVEFRGFKTCLNSSFTTWYLYGNMDKWGNFCEPKYLPISVHFR
jgi:hypothetical protein